MRVFKFIFCNISFVCFNIILRVLKWFCLFSYIESVVMTLYMYIKLVFHVTHILLVYSKHPLLV